MGQGQTVCEGDVKSAPEDSKQAVIRHVPVVVMAEG